MYRLRISTAPVGHCSHIGPYLLGYLWLWLCPQCCPHNKPPLIFLGCPQSHPLLPKVCMPGVLRSPKVVLVRSHSNSKFQTLSPQPYHNTQPPHPVLGCLAITSLHLTINTSIMPVDIPSIIIAYLAHITNVTRFSTVLLFTFPDL